MRKSAPMSDFQMLHRRIYGQALWPKHEKKGILRLAPRNCRGKGALLSFLRHDEIYRSDGFKTHPQLAAVCCLPLVGLRAKVKGCGFDVAPFPSSAMSLGLGIPWQVALQQSLPPLSQPKPLCNDKDWSDEQFSADGTCLTNSVSQKSPQSTRGVTSVFQRCLTGRD